MTIRSMFMEMVEDVARAMSSIHAPWTHKSITPLDAKTIEQWVQPGDVLLSETDGELGNLFITGDWKHAALYAGNGAVIEAKTKGVSVSGLIEFCLTKDRIAILRPKLVPMVERLRAVEWARQRIGLPYDFRFDSSAKSLYCSELIVKAYQCNLGVKWSWRFGTLVIFPQAFMDAIGNSLAGWELVYRSKEA